MGRGHAGGHACSRGAYHVVGPAGLCILGWLDAAGAPFEQPDHRAVIGRGWPRPVQINNL